MENNPSLNNGAENTTPPSSLTVQQLDILRHEFPGASLENLAGALSVARAEGATTDHELLSIARKALAIAAPIILP